LRPTRIREIKMLNLNKLVRLILLCIFLLCSLNSNAQDTVWTESYKVVSSTSFKNGKFTLKKKIDPKVFRKNPQGTTYYKTTFAVDLEYNGQTVTSIVDSTLYTSAKEDLGMIPCVLIDEERQFIAIFSNSKEDDGMFGLEGFVYQMLMNSNKWVKETLFTKANFGWFSFFGGSNNGNPELWHFSYAGGAAMLSIRIMPGRWNTVAIAPIKEEAFIQQYLSRKKVLITSSPGLPLLFE